MASVRRSENSARSARFLGPLRHWGGKWLRWTWAERGMVLQALVVLPIIACGLKWLGYRRIRTLLGGLIPRRFRSADSRNPVPVELETAVRVGRLVNGAARWGVIRANCLTRSLMVWWLLARRGIASEIVIGTQIANNEFQAHAWVECHQVVVNDRQDVAERFRPF